MENPFNNVQKMNDIIFAKRNKLYGAYAIRSSYHSTLIKSLGTVISAVLLFSASMYALTHRAEQNINHQDGNLGGFTTTYVDITPPDKPKVNPPDNTQKPPKSNAIATVIRDTANINSQNNVTNNNINPNGDPNGDPNALTSIGSGTGTSTGTFTIEKPEIPEPPTAFPVEEPEFEGGLKALRDFIANNIHYPDVAREIGKEGTVFMTFIIDESGKVESTKVLKGIGAGCDEEAARVIGKLPKFKKPGKNAIGKPVKTIFNIPIAFRLR